jgi:hypothetical protein
LGQPVSDPELVGWLSQWRVSARDMEGETVLSVLPAAEPTELMINIAEWLQDVIADEGVSAAVPPCPGHQHPMRPRIHEGQAWWCARSKVHYDGGGRAPGEPAG